MPLIGAEVKFILPFEINKDNGWYVASCPILDVHSQGKTKQKAKGNLIEALSLFFISCIERDTLSAVLKECGFKPMHAVKPTKKLNRSRFLNIDIPLNINNAKIGCPA